MTNKKILTAMLTMGLALAAFGCQHSQKTFDSPQAATDALAAAVENHDKSELRRIFGRNASKLRSGDAEQDRADFERFAAMIREKHTFDKISEDVAVVEIGEIEWPFAVPLVNEEGKWRFDTEAGIEELENRRIGRNELVTIVVCETIHDAQQQYMEQDRNGDGVKEYAQKMMSTAGQKDGLYWPSRGGADPSPIGRLLAEASARHDASGRRPPFHGYLYKGLPRQGPSASGGARDYLVNGRLTGGWAIIAWPAEYDTTGVTSFIINQDGAVYEKDLGWDTASAVAAIDTFDPGDGWKRVGY